MRVLFLGNSHTYFHDMPHTFSRMCRQLTGETPEVTMLAYSNKDLHWHREEYFAVRFALLYGNYDYCVLQQQAHPFPDEEYTRKSILRIKSLCESVGTVPVLYMTWAMRDEPENFPPMSRFYHRLAEEWAMKMVPVGDLFHMIRQSNPEIDLFWSDGAHASAYGDYLIAAAFASCLCNQRDLSAIDDRAVDFQLDFEGEDGMPLALEDAVSAEIMLEPEKTEAIRKSVEQYNRIVHYESILDRLTQALRSEESCRALSEMADDKEELEAYYQGPLWRTDFDADEAGILPNMLRRGVLSEDAVYNLLTEWDSAGD